MKMSGNKWKKVRSPKRALRKFRVNRVEDKNKDKKEKKKKPKTAKSVDGKNAHTRTGKKKEN